MLLTSCIADMFNKTLSSKDTLHWTQPYHMKRIVQNIFAHRHAVFTIISVLYRVCYQSNTFVLHYQTCMLAGFGLVWFPKLSNLVLHGSGGSSRVIRCNTCCSSPGAGIKYANGGWVGPPPPPDHQSLALSCLHSNFKGWMVWIEPGAGSESKTKLIVAGLGLFTISGSPPSF